MKPRAGESRRRRHTRKLELDIGRVASDKNKKRALLRRREGLRTGGMDVEKDGIQACDFPGGGVSWGDGGPLAVHRVYCE